MTERKSARHTTNSFDDQQAISSVSAWIAKTHRAMPDLKANDKWPNIDGYINLTDPDGREIGLIRAQVKKLHPQHVKRKTYTFKDDKFLSFCRESTDWIPTIFIGVDLVGQCAYWLQVDKDTAEELGGAKTIRLLDSQVISADSTTFITEWNRIIKLYDSKKTEYEQYKKAFALISDTITPALGRTDEKFIPIHQFLDTTNALLDREFAVVKSRYYPGSWKVGFGYYGFDETTVAYVVYPIPEGKNDVQIKQLSKKLRNQLQAEGLALTVHFGNNPIRSEPRTHAVERIKQKVQDILRYHRLDHSAGLFLAREYVYAFVDKFHVQMGLAKKDSYEGRELKTAFYQYLPLWLDETAKFMTLTNHNHFNDRVQSGKITFHDPGWLAEVYGEQGRIAAGVEARLKAAEEIPRIGIGNDQLLPPLFDEFLSALSGQAGAIDRPYKPKDYTRGGGRVWNALSAEDLTYNMKTFFAHFLITYRALIDTNFPYLRDELAFEGGATRLIFLLDTDDMAVNQGPSYILFFLKSADGEPVSQVEVVKKSERPELVSPNPRRTITLDGVEYQVLTEHHGRLRFIYHQTPMFEYLYESLTERMEKYFKRRAQNS